MMESEENIRKIVGQVKHPAINAGLVELGIVKEISMLDGKASILFAFPFATIPIRDQLINSVTGALARHDIETEIKTTVMTQDELNKFLTLEKQNWVGGV